MLQTIIYDDVKAFLSRHEMSVRSFGIASAKNHHIISHLENKDLTTKTINRMYAFMRQEDAVYQKETGKDVVYNISALSPP